MHFSSLNRFFITLAAATLLLPCIVMGQDALPVENISLKAKAEYTQVKLNWESLNERDVKYFRVERAADGMNFSILGTPVSKGNGSHSYQYTDALPLPGTSYYRIQAIDKAGTFYFSDIVPVTTKQVESSINLYPNPASDYLHIHRSSNAVATATCVDATGKELLRSVLLSSDDKVDVSTLPAGNYYMVIEVEGSRFVRTFSRS